MTLDRPLFRLLLVLVGLGYPASSLAADITSLADKINQRLSDMKDVAGYKARNHLPVEDLAQEAKVLDSAKAEARKLGLDPGTVEPLVTAQIKAAKAIEYRYEADWLAEPEANWQPRPLDEVRQEIAGLSNEILQQLAQSLKRGTFEPGDRSDFFKIVRETNLKDPDRQQLFNALLAVRLADRG